MTEIIFEVQDDETDGGYTASALGFGIHTQGETLDELRTMVREAVECYFENAAEAPKLIRLHYVRDEVMVARNCPEISMAQSSRRRCPFSDMQ